LKKNHFFTDYLRSLKAPCAEELVDLALFRPLGYLFVKAVLPLPVRPNQVSLLAMAFGIAAGLCLAHGTPKSYAIGGLLYGLSNVLDCSDGMLARIKKNGTATGRIVDGVVDYVTGAAVFVGLGIGLTKAVHGEMLNLPANAWVLVVFTALCTALHAVSSDYFRNTYLDQQHSSSAGIESDLEKYGAELSRLDSLKGHGVDKMLIRVYLGYLKLQAGNSLQRKKRIPAAPRQMIKPSTVMLWNLIGPSTHISFFIAAILLFRPQIFFDFVLIGANAWMLFLFIVRGIGRIRLRTTSAPD
jgi:phosphatidylglycerophosphate synthase